MASQITTYQNTFLFSIERNLDYWQSASPALFEVENIILAIQFGLEASLTLKLKAANLLVRSFSIFEQSGNLLRFLSLADRCPADLPPSTRLSINNLTGLCHWKLGEVAQAEVVFSAVRGASQRGHLSNLLADSLYGLCLCEISKLNLVTAEKLAISAIHLYFQQKRVMPILLTQNVLATIYFNQGEFSKAESFLKNTLEILNEYNPEDTNLSHQLSANLALAQINQAPSTKALASLGETAQSLSDTGNIPTLLQVEANRILLYIRLGHQAQAKNTLQRILHLSENLSPENKNLQHLLDALSDHLSTSLS